MIGRKVKKAFLRLHRNRIRRNFATSKDKKTTQEDNTRKQQNIGTGREALEEKKVEGTSG